MNEKENHLPNLSDKERAHALELAMKARKRRAVLKARMKSGELAFTDALIMQSIYPWLRNLWKKSKSQKGKIDNGK